MCNCACLHVACWAAGIRHTCGYTTPAMTLELYNTWNVPSEAPAAEPHCSKPALSKRSNQVEHTRGQVSLPGLYPLVCSSPPAPLPVPSNFVFQNQRTHNRRSLTARQVPNSRMAPDRTTTTITGTQLPSSHAPATTQLVVSQVHISTELNSSTLIGSHPEESQHLG